MEITRIAALVAANQDADAAEPVWNAAWFMAQLAPVTPLVLTIIGIAVLWKWRKIALTDVAVIIVTIVMVLMIPVLNEVVTPERAQSLIDAMTNLPGN